MMMTNQAANLPPFLVKHLDLLAKNRTSESRTMLTRMQKTIAPKLRTLSGRQNAEKKEASLGSECPSVLDVELQNLGITGATRSKLLATYTQEGLLSAVTFVKNTSKKQAIHSPAGFFVSVLTHGWDLQKPSKERKNEKLQPAATIEQSVDSIETLAEENLCKTLRRALCEEIGISEYYSWFSRTHWKIDETKLIIETPSSFVQSQLSLCWQHLIQQLLRKANDHVSSCTVTVVHA